MKILWWLLSVTRQTSAQTPFTMFWCCRAIGIIYIYRNGKFEHGGSYCFTKLGMIISQLSIIISQIWAIISYNIHHWDIMMDIIIPNLGDIRWLYPSYSIIISQFIHHYLSNWGWFARSALRNSGHPGRIGATGHTSLFFDLGQHDDAWKKTTDGTEHKHTYPRFVLIPNVPSHWITAAGKVAVPSVRLRFSGLRTIQNPWVCDFFFFFFFFFLSWQRSKLMTHDQQMAPGWQKMSLPHVQVAIYKDLVPITHWTGRGVLTVSYPNTMSR